MEGRGGDEGGGGRKGGGRRNGEGEKGIMRGGEGGQERK